MWPNPQFPVALVTITEEILHGKLHFLCSVCCYKKKVILVFQDQLSKRILFLSSVHSAMKSLLMASLPVTGMLNFKHVQLSCK